MQTNNFDQENLCENKKVVQIRSGFWKEIENSPSLYAHVLAIATKPDIIKIAPLYGELKKRKELVILVHTGQHFDYNLSKGVLQEFGMIVDVNLGIHGQIYQKYAQIIDRFGCFLQELSKKYHKIPIPYVHGDTLTATTTDKAAFLNRFSVVHVEAGIRTFTPNKHFFHRIFSDWEQKKFDWDMYYKELQNHTLYELGSIEPFPEQFDTRGIEPSTGYFAAPHEIYKRTLMNEGFSDDHIDVVGNTIADAVRYSCTKISHSQAFKLYPNMKGKKNIFVTIHRQENCLIKERFLAIYFGIKKLILEGYPVCFLELNASKEAIARYGLEQDLKTLIQDHPDNFAYGPVLAHHHEVMDMISKSGCIMTDSGSMQEEANIIGTPCVTVRFGSDRSETLFAGVNVLAPPVNAGLIAEITKCAYDNPHMRKKNIYGENVSEKIVNGVLKILQKDRKLFRLDHERLQIEAYFNTQI